MTYRIPSDDDVAKAIEDCMSAHPRIKTQQELQTYVSSELRSVDRRFRIGADRIRRIGIGRGIIDIEIRYARSNRIKQLDSCPVCRDPLKPIRNMTLDGDVIELRRVCRACGYSAAGEADRPFRYTITKR